MAGPLGAIWLIWGMNWVVMKVANSYFPPVQFVTYRFASGALVLLLIGLWLRAPLPPRRFWPWLFLTGILQISWNSALVQVGMESLGAGMTAVLNYTMPLWVAVLAHFFLGERLTWKKALGIGISLAGMYLLMGMQDMKDLGAAALVLLAAVIWALAGILTKMKLSDCNMLQLVTWQMVCGSAALLIYTAAVPQGDVLWETEAVLCLAYNGALASAAAFFLWNYLLVRIEAGKAAIAILGVPVVGVLGGIFLLQEPFTLPIAAGMGMVLSGILLVVHQKKRK